jgi:hypothetical protein
MCGQMVIVFCKEQIRKMKYSRRSAVGSELPGIRLRSSQRDSVFNQHIEQAALLAYTSQFAVCLKDVGRGILCIE